MFKISSSNVFPDRQTLCLLNDVGHRRRFFDPMCLWDLPVN